MTRYHTVNGDTVTISSKAAVDEASHFFLQSINKKKKKYVALTIYQVSQPPPTDAQLVTLTRAIRTTDMPIRELYLDPSFLGNFQEQTAINFLHALGGRHPLKEVWWFGTGEGGHSYLKLISQLLKKVTRLEKLFIKGIFAGSVQDFEDFGAALRDQRKLNQVDLSKLKLADENKSRACTDPILLSLGGLPMLRELISIPDYPLYKCKRTAVPVSE